MREAVIAGLAIFSVCVVVLWPLVFGGYPTGDNFEFNTPWFAYFIDQFRAGDLYPRWLTDYSNGFGAPIFYFYGPAPFFIAASADAICGGCDLQTALTLTHVALYALSFGAFFSWSRTLVGARISLLCAAVYTFSPYHLIDLERRASFGEATAYIFMPLALLGAQEILKSRRVSILGAFSYSLIIISHLPTAVLFSLALAVFILSQSPRSDFVKIGGSAALTGIIGASLAAFYLGPALALQDFLAPDGWLRALDHLQSPESLLLFSPESSRSNLNAVHGAIITVLAATTSIAAASVALLIIVRMAMRACGPLFSAEHGQRAKAAALTLVFCWVMMTDAVRWVYVNVEPIRMVQFPWRIGAVVDLMSTTILAIAAGGVAALLSAP